MTDAPAPFDDLVETARSTRVAVVGAGIAGLVAALECAKVGFEVALLDAADELGGMIRSAEVGGIRLDVAVDGYATAGRHVRRLIDELGLGADVHAGVAGDAWVAGIPGGAAPLPRDAILGIPANVWDPSVRRIIGMRGTWRAYLDRLRPPLTIGTESNLDTLVRGRMGDLVVQRLVAPLTVGRHGLTPAEVDVDAAAPGLNAALTRAGSLSDAVGRRLREEPPSGYETLSGGMTRLVDALVGRLRLLDVEIVTGARVEELVRADAGGWSVRHRAGEAIDVDHVVVAAPEPDARRLLAPHVSGVVADVDASRLLDVVTLVVDEPALDAHPRRTAVYVVPGSHAASAVVDSSARWPTIAAAAGPGRHVLRVMLPGDRERTDGGAIEEATAEATALLGAALPPVVVRGARRDRYEPAVPPSAAGHAARSRGLRAAVHAVSGLSVTGAWLAGSGLANVIPDAVAEAERLRKRALFGASAAE